MANFPMVSQEEEQDLEIDEKEHAFSILQSFGIMRGKEEHSYFTIKVGNEGLRVHRELMIAASGYISAMFAHDTVEKKTGVLDMKCVEFCLVKKCIDFIYTGKISISLDKCEDLLYVACLMQLWTLREHIGRFLKKYLNVRSFFQMWNLVLKFSIENLNKFCSEFAYENLEMVAKEEDFLDLDADVVSLFLNVRKSCLPGGEDHKVIVILRWVKHDTENRHEYVAKLLKSVDLKNVSMIYSRSLIESEPLFYQSAEVIQMFYLATMDNHSVKRQKLDPDLHRIPNTLIAFDIQSQALQAYRPLDKAHAKISELHPDMSNKKYTAVAIRNHVYVLMENRRFFRLNVFEPELGWVEMCKMLNCHRKASEPGTFGSIITETTISSAVLNENIYVAGGNSMERYSLRDDEWHEIESEGISLDHPVLVAHQGEIYNIGYSVNSAQKYSPELGVWTRFAPIGTRVYWCHAISYKDKIFSIMNTSNYSRVAACKSYDKISNAWSDTPFSFGLSHHKLCVCVGVLLVVDDEMAVYRYASSKGRWAIHIESQARGINNGATVSIWLPSRTTET